MLASGMVLYKKNLDLTYYLSRFALWIQSVHAKTLYSMVFYSYAMRMILHSVRVKTYG